MKLNENVALLPDDYIFAAVRKKAETFARTSGTKLVDLGVGDVKLPLFTATVDAMKKACDELGKKETFRGYPPAEGYMFLREKISETIYGGAISPDEIFITDGAKGALGSVSELFARGIKILFPTPAYPAGAEANILLGNRVDTLVTRPEEDFMPFPPYGEKYDVIYLCSPSNPTGAVMTKKLLGEWVDYALSTDAIIVFDAAYSVFTANGEPKSIYEIPRAKECATEINSFSKSMGFTGVRCGYEVVPKSTGELYRIKKRMVGVRTNGVSYVSQRGAETFFSPDGYKEVTDRAEFYKTNADVIKIALKNADLWYNNTRSTPYVFAKCPDGFTSTTFCDELLCDYGIIATPGSGFGDGGEGFVRFSAFCSRSDALEFLDRITASR